MCFLRKKVNYMAFIKAQEFVIGISNYMYSSRPIKASTLLDLDKLPSA